MKEKGIGVKLHQDLAYKFMEVATATSDDNSGESEISVEAVEIKKLYTQLGMEENKSSTFKKELDVLKAEHVKLQQTILENEETSKKAEEDHMHQIKRLETQ